MSNNPARRPLASSALGAALGCALSGAALLGCASDRRPAGSSESVRAAATPASSVASSSVASSPASGAPSSACSSESPLPLGLSERHVTSGGIGRRFLVHLPAGYDRRSPLPLVLEFHGSGGSPEGQLATSQLTALADAEHFAIVAPASVGPRWNIPPDPAKPDDVRFAADVLDAMGALLCIQPERVYATGFSGGARMSSQLACDLSQRIAAIAAIGGIRFPGPCSEARSMPILAFHGSADRTNPYAGGGEAYWGTGVESAFDGWGRHNGCGPRRERSVAPSVVELAYGGGSCADVVLYRIDGFGHSWPGAIYPDREAGTANDLLWAFFESHPLPATPPH
jgi:polyhydroxybutyrate depolymerase